MKKSVSVLHGRRGQEGQVLYLFAGSFVVLMLLAGLVADTGFAYVKRRDAQNVSDLATLAGTKVVADNYVYAVGTVGGRNSANVYHAIDVNAQANGCTVSANCSWTAWYVDGSRSMIGPVPNASSAVPGGSVGVQVDVHWPAPTIIVGPALSILGLQPISAWEVKTTATGLAASSTQQAPAGQLLPISLFGASANSFTPGNTYNITDAALNNPGNFGWLTWQGSQSAGTVDTSVCTTDNPAFTLPTWIGGSTGVKQQGGNSGKPGTTLACLNYYKDHAIPVLIPVYDGVTDGNSTSCGSKRANGSNTQYCIIGVVSMIITNVNWGAGIKEIDGTFQSVYQFQPGSVPAGAGAAPPAPGDKFYYLGLVH
jgi:hypothetical protein